MLGGATTSEVFISYAREDVAVAEHFAQVLGEQGWNVWWDRELVAGSEFDRAIEEKLANAAAVIVIWSPISVESRWVRSEASVAADRGILVPLVFDGVEMPLQFRTLQAIELGQRHAAPTPSVDAELVGAVRALVGSTPRPIVAPHDAPPATHSASGTGTSADTSKRWVLIAIGAAAAIGLIGVGAVLASRGGGDQTADAPDTTIAPATTAETIPAETDVTVPADTEPTTSGGPLCSERAAGDIASVVAFSNTRAAPVDLYWVAADCQQTFYATVQPGQSVDQATYVGDVWQIRLADGTMILEDQVTDTEETWETPT